MRFAEIRGSGLGSVIAENNSTQFYIKVIGSQNDLSNKNLLSRVEINKVRSGTIMNRGLNVQRFDSNMKLVEERSFDIYDNVVVQGKAFVDYVLSTSTGLLAIYTFDAISNSDLINSLMRDYGASAWPWHLKSTKRFAWCGIVDCANKNMVSDAAGGLGDSFPAMIDYYIDTMSDLGITGAGNVIVQDPNEYSGKEYLVHEYMKKTSLSEIKQLRSGEWLLVRADLMQDAEAIANNAYATITVQFYDENSSYLKAITIRGNSSTYKTVETKSDIPAGAFYMDIGLYHSPIATAGKGLVTSKNLVVQPVSKEVVKKLPARLGRFTAPAKEFREGTLTGATVVKFTKDELIEASEMQELSDGEWIKVFEHRLLGQNYLFENIDASLYSEIPYLYSNMQGLPDLRLKDGRWRFKIVYDDKYMIWEQSSSVEKDVAEGFKLIETNMVDYSPMGGLRRTTGTAVERSRYGGSLIENNWYYSIGATELHEDGIPGWKEASRNVQLYAWKE